MMQMLKAGGMELLTDSIRQPDANNVRGYFEYEKVKSLPNDNSWLSEAEDKAVKIIIQLIHYLPSNFDYSVIIMKRNIDEIMLSQERMIENLAAKKATAGKDILKKVFENQLRKNEEYLSSNSNFRILSVNYNELMAGNGNIIQDINAFLDSNLNVGNIPSAIESSLYRTRLD